MQKIKPAFRIDPRSRSHPLAEELRTNLQVSRLHDPLPTHPLVADRYLKRDQAEAFPDVKNETVDFKKLLNQGKSYTFFCNNQGRKPFEQG